MEHCPVTEPPKDAIEQAQILAAQIEIAKERSPLLVASAACGIAAIAFVLSRRRSHEKALRR